MGSVAVTGGGAEARIGECVERPLATRSSAGDVLAMR
jgi:hypothetical protein